MYAVFWVGRHCGEYLGGRVRPELHPGLRNAIAELTRNPKP